MTTKGNNDNCNAFCVTRKQNNVFKIIIHSTAASKYQQIKCSTNREEYS